MKIVTLLSRCHCDVGRHSTLCKSETGDDEAIDAVRALGCLRAFKTEGVIQVSSSVMASFAKMIPFLSSSMSLRTRRLG